MKIQSILRVALVALAFAGCSFPRAATTHISWSLDRNLIVVEAVVDGVAGQFAVGSAHPNTILDVSRPAARSGTDVPITVGRHSGTAKPVAADLGGLADGILGADVWRSRSLTIDYKRRLLILGRALEPVDHELRHRFRDAPSIPITIDGREEIAVIDTANPDTIFLPTSRFGPEGRIAVDLVLADVRLHEVDAAVVPASDIRLGNRILSEFLVTIDYPRREASLWYNP